MRLTIYSYKCSDIELFPISDRWYKINHPVDMEIITNVGTYRIKLDKDFHFDGRSGGPFADLIAPNLGTQNEVKAWLLHDVLGYDIGLSFKETNDALYWTLIYNCAYHSFKASLIRKAVSVSDSWFGRPKEGDRELINNGKIHLTLSDK